MRSIQASSAEMVLDAADNKYCCGIWRGSEAAFTAGHVCACWQEDRCSKQVVVLM